VGIGNTDDENMPERPEVYDVLLQLRRFNMKWVDGGYEDQPCILIEELNQVYRAEEEHSIRKLINQRNKEAFNANKPR
jgi:hypothetical protein